MISLSNKAVSNISKIVLFGLAAYSVFFISVKAINYYKTYYEKEKLTNELQVKREITNTFKAKINETKNNIAKVEKSYIPKEELENRVKDIFARMSLVDYELNYIDAKKMCIDRYIIVARVKAQSEKGAKAAEGILSYLGEIKKSELDESLYFVNYISKPKEIK